MKNHKNKQQELFFQRIKDKLSDNISLVVEIAQLLSISNDAAYRRIRSEKLLDFAEISTLCAHFNLGFDEHVSENKNSVMFNYMPLLDNFEQNYLMYAHSLSDALRAIVKQKNKKLYFAATDIPVFYLCKFPELKAFKMYTWRKQIGEFENEKFVPELILNENLRAVFKEISELYNQIDSVEVWTNSTIDSILKLILYHFEIDGFRSIKEALFICEQLEQLLAIIKLNGETSTKKHHNTSCNFQLFLSEIELENNLAYVETDAFRTSLIKLYSINAIHTSDVSFCNGAEIWFKNVINKSTLISGSSQKQFKIFIKESLLKIEILKQNLYRQT